ncbi:hypothetical protein [Halosimplex amylolyticum]|uniref:hypothetical protein n=1 Tax=Halosimplex amylolyticum TaxID=3396616 RepID=UPI003F54D5D4
MDEATAGDRVPATVEWRAIGPEEVSSPVVRRLPYLELKLEHPALEPSGRGDRFFPDAVPYELEGTARAFYWRPAVAPSTGDPRDWELACATTHELAGIDVLPAACPALVTEGASGTTVVVDGTVGGETTTSHVRSYAPPDVRVDTRSDAGIELVVAGSEFRVSTGERRQISLPEQRVEPVDSRDEPVTVAPELVVRYPGRRELHHPAVGATYRLFPSFGLDLDAVPNPLPVPTAADELDDAALATELGVDLSDRPYPERVLWQAFAYTAFDPHAERSPQLTQLASGHIVLRTGALERN